MACERVLICGVSTRAAAESAARAGFDVTAIDAFGDLDQYAGVRALSLPRDFGRRFTPAAAAAVARGLDCDAAAYLSPFENHPRAVQAIAAGRTLLGNPPDVLRRVRDPDVLAGVLQARGFRSLAVRMDPPDDPNDRDGSNGPDAWVLKPIRSGGGHRIRRWRRGERIPSGCYLQQQAAGTPGSFLFVAARGAAAPIGISRQLTGEAAFGATGYRYCGNIVGSADVLRFARHDLLVRTLRAIAGALADEFSLAGVNGIDFVANDGVPFTVEVNPRWSGSAELVEAWSGRSVFAAHAAACLRGTLPNGDAPAGRRPGAVGKAIVFARANVAMGETRSWLAEDGIRDVPHPGERIASGRPVCTVLASGRDADECHAALAARADAVYEALDMRRAS